MLNSSLEGLARVLMQRKELAAKDEEDKRKEELGRAMLGLRGQEVAETGASHRASAASQEAHQKRLEDYQKELIAAQKEGNADRRTQETFRIFSEMGKNGMLTDEGVNAMSQKLQEQFAPAGVGVKLFKLPPATKTEPGAWTNPKTGSEYSVFGNTILPADKPRGRVIYKPDPTNPEGPMVPTLTQDLSDEAIQNLIQQKTAPPATSGDIIKDARLKKIEADLKAQADKIAAGDETTGLFGMGQGREKAIQELLTKKAALMGPAATPPGALPAGLPPPAAAPAARPGEDRVRVMGPDGKIGTVPKSQLDQAIAQGFKPIP